MLNDTEYSEACNAAFDLKMAMRELSDGVADHVIPTQGPAELYSVCLTVHGRLQTALSAVHATMKSAAANRDCQAGAFSMTECFDQHRRLKAQAQQWLKEQERAAEDHERREASAKSDAWSRE